MNPLLCSPSLFVTDQLRKHKQLVPHETPGTLRNQAVTEPITVRSMMTWLIQQTLLSLSTNHSIVKSLSQPLDQAQYDL